MGLRVYKNNEEKQSEEVKSDLNAEINRLLNESHSRVTKILTEHKAELDLISAALLMKKTLYADEIKSIIDDRKSELSSTSLAEPSDENSSLRYEKKADNEQAFDVLSANGMLSDN